MGMVVYKSRVAYKKLLALPVGLVSSRCSAQALFTHYSLNSLIAQTLLTLLSHYSLLHVYSRVYYFRQVLNDDVEKKTGN